MSDDALPNDTKVSSGHPMLKEMAGLWWLPLIRGIMMLILGAYALFRPAMTAATFVQVLGIFLAVDGVLAIISGITGKVASRGWTIGRGVLELLAGLAIIANPLLVTGIAAMTLVYFVGFASVISGVMEIVAAIKDRKEIEGEGFLILGGVIAVIFGLAILSSPLAFAGMMVRIIGILAIIGGVASIFFAFRLRGLGKHLQEHDARHHA